VKPERFSVLLDTGVVIAHLRGFPGVAELLISLGARGPLATSVVTVVEVWQGAKAREAERTQLFFSGVEVIPLEAELAEAAGHLARSLREKGYTVGLADAVVAATAQHLDVPVLTTNKKHFEHVPGLRVRDLRESLSDDGTSPPGRP
jgi:predicted nucleic acid-binding protein